MSPIVAYKMIQLAWRNVLRNWRHSLATILAIASGFMAISLFDGFLKELSYTINDGYGTRGMLGDVIIQKKDAQAKLDEDSWKYSLTKEDQIFLEDFFAKDPAFQRRVRYLHLAGLVSAGNKNTVFMGFGYDLAEGAAIRGKRWAWNTVRGIPLHLTKKPSIVVGQGLGTLLDCESDYQGEFTLPEGNYVPKSRPFHCKNPRFILSATTEAAQVNAIGLEVSGFIDAGFREADKRFAHISLADAQRLLDTDKLTMISVDLKDNADAKAFIGRLESAAQANGLAFDVTLWMEHKLADYVRGGLDLLSVFRNLFMVIVVTIGVMSVANTMMKSVNERIREIGTFRSLGYLRSHLILMFAVEGFFISLIACAIGLVATLVLTEFISYLGITYRAGVLSVPMQLQVKYAPLAWFWSAVSLSILATVTAWFCARKASRMVIADAMRHV